MCAGTVEIGITQICVRRPPANNCSWYGEWLGQCLDVNALYCSIQANRMVFRMSPGTGGILEWIVKHAHSQLEIKYPGGKTIYLQFRF